MKTFKPLKDDIRYDEAVKKMKKVRGFYVHLIIYILVNSIATGFVIWGDGRFVFGSPWLWWGLGLLLQAYFVFGQDLFFSKSWKERKIKEIMDKENDNL